MINNITNILLSSENSVRVDLKDDMKEHINNVKDKLKERRLILNNIYNLIFQTKHWVDMESPQTKYFERTWTSKFLANLEYTYIDQVNYTSIAYIAALPYHQIKFINRALIARHNFYDAYSKKLQGKITYSEWEQIYDDVNNDFGVHLINNIFEHIVDCIKKNKSKVIENYYDELKYKLEIDLSYIDYNNIKILHQCLMDKYYIYDEIRIRSNTFDKGNTIYSYNNNSKVANKEYTFDWLVIKMIEKGYTAYELRQKLTHPKTLETILYNGGLDALDEHYNKYYDTDF